MSSTIHLDNGEKCEARQGFELKSDMSACDEGSDYISLYEEANAMLLSGILCTGIKFYGSR